MKTFNRGKRFNVDPLTKTEVESLIKSCGPNRTGDRNRCILIVAYRCGLRSAELADLQLTDIDLDASTLTVQHGKGDKRRIVGLDLLASEAIRSWLRVRKSDTPYLFPTKSGRLDTSYLRRLLPRLARKAGIAKRCHPHVLRHSFATHAAPDLSLQVLSQALGHANVATTARYIAKLNPMEVVQAMASRC